MPLCTKGGGSCDPAIERAGVRRACLGGESLAEVLGARPRCEVVGGNVFCVGEWKGCEIMRFVMWFGG